MQIKRRRSDSRLTQHHMDLGAMVRLMVEKVQDRDSRRFQILPALVVRVRRMIF